MPAYDPEEPALGLVFPEEGDAILLLESAEMLESEDGDLCPGLRLNPGMALEMAHRLICWAIAKRDAEE